MNIFSTILEKLGLKKSEPAPVAPVAPVAAPAVSATSHVSANPLEGTTAAAPVTPASTVSSPTVAPAPPSNIPTAPTVKPVSEVDVVKHLNQLADGSGLDWKVSIVDLLKLLKLDSSLDTRKQLATELGCPAELIGGDYSKMNVWLHKTVLAKIAENGGNIPQELLK